MNTSKLDAICDFFDAYDRARAAQNARFDAYVADLSVREAAKAVVEVEYSSIEAFVSYLADDEREVATIAEVGKLVQRTRMSRSDVVKAIRAAGIGVAL